MTVRWRARWMMSSTQAVPLQLAAALSLAVGLTMWMQVLWPQRTHYVSHTKRLPKSSYFLEVQFCAAVRKIER